MQDCIENWRGRGACMVIYDWALWCTNRETFEGDFIGVALHELAHILCRSPLTPRSTRNVPSVGRSVPTRWSPSWLRSNARSPNCGSVTTFSATVC